MKLKLLFLLSLVILSFISWRFIYADGVSNNLDTNAIELRMRSIGHQLLLKAGDSSSRVLPIEMTSPGNYQILFESQLTLEPDTLVQVVNNSLQGLELPVGYMVNVKSCANDEIVYGFEIQRNHKEDVVPCLGRSLPKACYRIDIVFLQAVKQKHGYSYLALSLLVSLLIGYLVFKKKDEPPGAENSSVSKVKAVGQFQFYFEKHLIKLGNQEIELTSKENQLLEVFTQHPNEIIDRSKLQKEVWENEGVIVGRSLDVFVSKLRKKLEGDDSVRIINIHGKGYKLEIDRA